MAGKKKAQIMGRGGESWFESLAESLGRCSLNYPTSLCCVQPEHSSEGAGDEQPLPHNPSPRPHTAAPPHSPSLGPDPHQERAQPRAVLMSTGPVMGERAGALKLRARRRASCIPRGPCTSSP